MQKDWGLGGVWWHEVRGFLVLRKVKVEPGEGTKAWWKCLPQEEAVGSVLNSAPSLKRPDIPKSQLFRKFRGVRGLQGHWKCQETWAPALPLNSAESQKTGGVLENNDEVKDGHRSSQRSWHNEAAKVGGKISKSLWFLWKVFFESPRLSILLNYFSQHLRVWMRKENSLRKYINAQGLLFRRGSQIARLKTHTHTRRTQYETDEQQKRMSERK